MSNPTTEDNAVTVGSSVPDLVDTIANGFASLRNGMAAYGAILRVLEDASSVAADGGNPPVEALQRPPVVTWPARFGTDLVEVHSDLSKVPPEQLPAVLGPLAELHITQMQAAAERIHRASGTLANTIKSSRDETARQRLSG